MWLPDWDVALCVICRGSLPKQEMAAVVEWELWLSSCLKGLNDRVLIQNVRGVRFESHLEQITFQSHMDVSGENSFIYLFENKYNFTKILENIKGKRGIFTTLISGFIGLAYESISSFLHNSRHKALHKAVKAIDKQAIAQHNKLMHLEDSMVMYYVHNAETLENLIHTVHHMHNSTIKIKKNRLQDNLTQHIHGILMHWEHYTMQ